MGGNGVTNSPIIISRTHIQSAKTAIYNGQLKTKLWLGVQGEKERHCQSGLYR